MFGMPGSEFNFIKATFIDPCKNLGIRVYIFGSRARGDQQKYSDLDFLLKDALKFKAEVAELLEQVEQSNFPYKVDTVYDEELAKSYRENIERDLKQV